MPPPDSTPTDGDDLGRHLPPEVVAAISAAHIRQGDYR